MAGDPFMMPDPELDALQDAARGRLKAFNDIPRSEGAARVAALGELTGRPCEAWVESPFMCEYGINIRFGRRVFVNANCVFLDSAPIVIGDRAAIGPGVQLLTPTHSLAPSERLVAVDGDPPIRAVCWARPVTIGNDCWIGAGAIVLPGVSVGDGTVVGAGSVVTESLPAHVLAVGSPARVVREIDAKPGPDLPPIPAAG
jgi:maltose O-acetyltransferase